MALQASRLGLSHWAGPSVTRSTSVSQGSNRSTIVVILAKGREVPLVWEFIYMTEEVIWVTSTVLPHMGLKSVTEAWQVWHVTRPIAVCDSWEHRNWTLSPQHELQILDLWILSSLQHPSLPCSMGGCRLLPSCSPIFPRFNRNLADLLILWATGTTCNMWHSHSTPQLHPKSHNFK